MSSLELQATLGQGKRGWHQINWAACQRRVRSLQRRLVQAVKSGAWRKVKRLSDGAWQAWRERYSPERGLEALEASYQRALNGSSMRRRD